MQTHFYPSFDKISNLIKVIQEEIGITRICLTTVIKHLQFTIFQRDR